eukprot:CAMPEP_0176120000 /NCGR_PEP_ID=MMETSP0120_2-20121206/60349_1 /TAXON_ID=160619 /ORGANISM="Kryptoperidinium foliaceum, Strain CCMP 1326" /LENGTH=728 /DNA_ID=CAMNT_0017454431 /DNA_START=40 /DNA_END=2226 /DNA_ORIENTATION=+
MKRILGASCFIGAACRAAASPVERVVKLLEDLQGKLEMDEKMEQKVYDKYACWCEKTSARKAVAISEAQADLRAFGQTILSTKGRVATLAAEISELDEAIQANAGATAKATSVRQKENEAYVADTAETKQALAALQRAIEVLVQATSPKPRGSNGEDVALVQMAASAIRSAIAALPAKAELSSERASLLGEFLRGGSNAAYSPQSFTVQGILSDMYDTFASDLESATRDEASENTKFEAFLAVKAEELQTLEADKAKKEGQKAAAEERLADTQQMYDDTAAQKKADIALFDETRASCEAKHEEWSTRSSLREEEIAGVAKAIAILTSDSARQLFASAIKAGKEVGASDKYDTGRDISFFQSGAAVSTAEAPERAYSILKRQATAGHSLRLASLAVRVRQAKVGHFGEVISAIDAMLTALKEENAADVTKRDQCKEEYTKIESKTKDLKWKIKNNAAKIEKLTKLIELRTAQKKKTIAEIQDVEDHMAELESLRQDENNDFLNAKKEDQDAIDLLTAARDVLKSYYAKNSITMGDVQGSVKGSALVQQPEFKISADQAPVAEFSESGKRKNEAKGVISIITMILEDLNDEIKNGMKAEEEAQLAFEEQMAAAKKLKDDLTAKKVSLEEAIAKRGEERQVEAGEKSEHQASLESELSYRASIKPDCDWILGAFEKRAAARSAEMDGLTGAKEFLVGAQPPAEEASFLERSTPAAAGKSMLSKVHFLGMRD